MSEAALLLLLLLVVFVCARARGHCDFLAVRSTRSNFNPSHHAVRAFKRAARSPARSAGRRPAQV